MISNVIPYFNALQNFIEMYKKNYKTFYPELWMITFWRDLLPFRYAWLMDIMPFLYQRKLIGYTQWWYTMVLEQVSLPIIMEWNWDLSMQS